MWSRRGDRCECFGKEPKSGEDAVCTKCSSSAAGVAYVLAGGRCTRPTTTQTTTTTTTTTDGKHPCHIRFPLVSMSAETQFRDVRRMPADVATDLSGALAEFITSQLETSREDVQILLLNGVSAVSRNTAQQERRQRRAAAGTAVLVDVTATSPQDQSAKYQHLQLAWSKSDAGKRLPFKLGEFYLAPERPGNMTCGTTSPQESCASVGGSYQQLQCDDDGIQDHVCLGAAFASVTSGKNPCVDRVTHQPALLYTPAMCDVQQASFESSVLPSRQYTTVDSGQNCPPEYAAIGSCDFCNTAAAAMGGGAGGMSSTCNTPTSAGMLTSPACMLSSSGQPSFHAYFNATAEPAGAKKICAGTSYGCQPNDVRLNVGDCDARTGLDAYIGIVVVVSSGAVMTVAFGVRYQFTGASLRLPLLLEATTFVCTLDLITDITYIATETFATPALYGFAILFILLPFVVPTLFFLGKGYQIITYENLQW